MTDINIQKLPRNTETVANKRIVLLDGRAIEVSLGEKLSILDRDGKTCPIYFDALDTNNPFHVSLFICLSITLSTHSLSYNSTVSLALRLEI